MEEERRSKRRRLKRGRKTNIRRMILGDKKAIGKAEKEK